MRTIPEPRKHVVHYRIYQLDPLTCARCGAEMISYPFQLVVRLDFN